MKYFQILYSHRKLLKPTKSKFVQIVFCDQENNNNKKRKIDKPTNKQAFDYSENL